MAKFSQAHNGDAFDHYVLQQERLRWELGFILAVASEVFDCQ
jgi:hypothetical protein